MGITAHFFGRKDQHRHSVTLAVRNFSHPHTGERVRELVDEVLREWEIPVSKVVAILTDNGSNMLRAFSTLVQDKESKESNDEESR